MYVLRKLRNIGAECGEVLVEERKVAFKLEGFVPVKENLLLTGT
jgi:hypothetical protein